VFGSGAELGDVGAVDSGWFAREPDAACEFRVVDFAADDVPLR